jgi:hypothetical protein
MPANFIFLNAASVRVKFLSVNSGVCRIVPAICVGSWRRKQKDEREQELGVAS